MILGILSDSHGQVARTKQAVDLLDRLGAEAFVHCGDVGSPDVLDALAGRQAWFAWGNCDMPDPTFIRYAEQLGLTPPKNSPTRLTLDDHSVEVFHGHEPAFVETLRAAQAALDDPAQASAPTKAYILHGHTHVAADRRFGPTRIINPGALHRARPYTVATLDLVNDVVRFWVVPDDASSEAAPLEFRLTA